MNTNIEQVVLKNILTNEKYMRKVIPFVKPDYFEGVYKMLFKQAGMFAHFIEFSLSQCSLTEVEVYRMSLMKWRAFKATRVCIAWGSSFDEATFRFRNTALYSQRVAPSLMKLHR